MYALPFPTEPIPSLSQQPLGVEETTLLDKVIDALRPVLSSYVIKFIQKNPPSSVHGPSTATRSFEVAVGSPSVLESMLKLALDISIKEDETLLQSGEFQFP